MSKVNAPRSVEEGPHIVLDFTKLQQIAATGLDVIPVAVQDADTREVLIVAYANKTALEYSLEHGVAAFWSTSRNKLWVKGATSGDTLQIVEIRVNCEQNSLLYMVRPLGQGACHTTNAAGTARKSCYYRCIRDGKLDFVEK